MFILALSGSLRHQSKNRATLEAAAMLAGNDITMQLYNDNGAIPHFSPDRDVPDYLPIRVLMLRQYVESAAALLIACPEYAGGIPGSFKNLLDWLVSAPEFYRKPVALINTSPHATTGQEALRKVLITMSATIVEAACASFHVAKGMRAHEIVALSGPRQALKGSLTALRTQVSLA